MTELTVIAWSSAPTTPAVALLVAQSCSGLHEDRCSYFEIRCSEGAGFSSHGPVYLMLTEVLTRLGYFLQRTIELAQHDAACTLHPAIGCQI